MSLCGGGTDNGTDARLLQEQRDARVATGLGSINSTFGQFNPQFYQQRKQDYINYAMPQLYQQLAQTNRQGAYGLANRGLSGSGAANQFGSNLTNETNVQKQNIADTAIGQSQQLQKDVEGQRSQLVAQLQASGDPTSAAQGALQSAGAYSLPSAFGPIGNLFGQFSQMYAQNQLSKAYQPGGYNSNYGMNNSLGRNSYAVTR